MSSRSVNSKEAYLQLHLRQEMDIDKTNKQKKRGRKINQQFQTQSLCFDFIPEHFQLFFDTNVRVSSVCIVYREGGGACLSVHCRTE